MRNSLLYGEYKYANTNYVIERRELRMKARRIIALALVIFVVGATSAAAGTLWGTYGDYAKVKVIINGDEKASQSSDVPAISMDGSTMLPAKLVIDSFGALMSWDQANQTLELNKPNVSITVAKELVFSKNGEEITSLKYPFGKVNKGDVNDFGVLVQVENLKANWSRVEVALYSPSGDKVVSFETEKKKGMDDSFWQLPVNMENIAFKEKGSYKVKVSFKTPNIDKYTVVAEKQILSN